MKENQKDIQETFMKQSIGEALQSQGWWVGNLLPTTLLDGLFNDAEQLRNHQQFRKAAIGAKTLTTIAGHIRGDDTYWIEGENATQQAFLLHMLALRDLFQCYFPIPLNNFDGHYAYYPAGAYYQKHMDNSRNTNSRIISAITYLNPCWNKGDGGELVLYSAEHSEVLTTIEPAFGKTALFFSTDFPHEVLETHKPRYSVTGWFHQRS